MLKLVKQPDQARLVIADRLGQGELGVGGLAREVRVRLGRRRSTMTPPRVLLGWRLDPAGSLVLWRRPR